MLSEVRLKKFEIYKKKHNSCVNNHSPKIFPVSNIFPVLQQNSLCFPCLEKVRTKFPGFPVFPVSWPPCFILNTTCPDPKSRVKLVLYM